MLRVVRPDDAGQAPRPRRKPSTLTLTASERARLRVLLRALRRSHGSWSCVGDVLDVNPKVLCDIAGGSRAGSPGVLLRAARAAGMPVEQVLSGKPTLAGRCPTCGRST